MATAVDDLVSLFASTVEMVGTGVLPVASERERAAAAACSSGVERRDKDLPSHPDIYRGDNYGGIMAPVFAVVFGAVCVFVLATSLRGDGPPLWFALLFISLVMAIVGTTTFLVATKIVVSHTLISGATWAGAVGLPSWRT